jgi:hypothetical protein
LDCEINKETGELPPTLSEIEARIRNHGYAALAYSSHNHTKAAPRYRIVLPLSRSIAVDLPAVEVIADVLELNAVLDRSKLGASSLFYLPSAAPDHLDDHEIRVIDGHSVDADWMEAVAGIILAERQVEAERIAEQAHRDAAARREAKIASGFNPDDSLIEKIRGKFDLDAVLRSHGYATTGGKTGTKYRHPNSQSGAYGADIKIFGGIERVYSHNGGDLLHTSNLPAWCGGVTALDAFDVVVILDYGSDRRRALSDMAKRLGLTKTAERKVIARLLFSMLKQRATQQSLETAAFAEGERLGLSYREICDVANWVAKEAA